MNLNRFNTTPQSHPHLYLNGEIYIGKNPHSPLAPGQKISAKETAEMLVLFAVNDGWLIGDLALTMSDEMRKRTGREGYYIDEEKAHGIGAAAMVSETRRCIISHLGQGEVLRLYNEIVYEEMPYDRYGYLGENCYSGGCVFRMLFGMNGSDIYSSSTAVYGDMYQDFVNRIDRAVLSLSVRIYDEEAVSAPKQSTHVSKRAKIISCPNCGKEVSTASVTCWCCDFPIPK